MSFVLVTPEEEGSFSKGSSSFQYDETNMMRSCLFCCASVGSLKSATKSVSTFIISTLLTKLLKINSVNLANFQLDRCSLCENCFDIQEDVSKTLRKLKEIEIKLQTFEETITEYLTNCKLPTSRNSFSKLANSQNNHELSEQDAQDKLRVKIIEELNLKHGNPTPLQEKTQTASSNLPSNQNSTNIQAYEITAPVLQSQAKWPVIHNFTSENQNEYILFSQDDLCENDEDVSSEPVQNAETESTDANFEPHSINDDSNNLSELDSPESESEEDNSASDNFKKRCRVFSPEEERVLVENYSKQRSVLASRKVDNEEKEQIWKNLAKIVSRISRKVSAKQCKTKIKNYLCKQSKINREKAEDDSYQYIKNEPYANDPVYKRLKIIEDSKEFGEREKLELSNFTLGNFSQDEMKVLLSEYVKNITILQNKDESNFVKHAHWLQIADSVSSSSGNTKSHKECRAKMRSFLYHYPNYYQDLEKDPSLESKTLKHIAGPEENQEKRSRAHIFTQKEEELIMSEYERHKEVLSDLKINPILKMKIWEQIAVVVSNFSNVYTTARQCSKKAYNMRRKMKLQAEISPEEVMKEENELNEIFRDIQLTEEDENFIALLVDANNDPISKAEIEATEEDKPIVSKDNSTRPYRVFSTAEERVLRGEYEKYKKLLRHKRCKPTTRRLIWDKISRTVSSFSNKQRTRYQCRKRINHIIFNEKKDVDSETEYFSGATENDELSLLELETLIREYSKFSSNIPIGSQTTDDNFSFETVRSAWKELATLVNLNMKNSLPNQNRLLSSKACFYNIQKFIEDSKKSYSKDLVWTAPTKSGPIYLKVPSLLLTPIEITNEAAFIKLSSIPKSPFINRDSRAERISQLKSKFQPKAQTKPFKNSLQLARVRSFKKFKRLKLYECEAEDCALKFSSYKSFQNHTKTHGATFKCDRMGCTKKYYNSALELQVHKSNVHDEENKKFGCDFCESKFKHRHQIKYHVKKVHEEKGDISKRFQCEFCPRTFSQKATLASHLGYFHGDENPEKFRPDLLTCPLCNVKVNSPFYLKIHIKRHNKDLPYHCKNCEFQSHSPVAIRNHEARVHQNLREWQCHLCPNTYKSKKNLELHFRLHAGTQVKVPCDLCGKSYESKNKLRLHKMAVHFPEPRFICSLCGKGFPIKDYYRTHFKSCSKKHKQQTQQGQEKIETN